MLACNSNDSLKTRRSLKVGQTNYDYFSLKAAQENGLGDLSRLPYSLCILLENLLRFENGRSVKLKDIQAIAAWSKQRRSDHEIAYRPTRVLMQDFTGVPAIVDLATMREAMHSLGGDPKKINPLSQVDLVIDHSVMVDEYGHTDAFQKNVEREFERNRERYAFLRWGQQAFDNFRVVPPGTGICHQVNIEYLAQVVWSQTEENQTTFVFPDTLVGTDSHTTMVNALGVLGWGVGGIEAEAAMLGQPISMVIPEVIGFELLGQLQEGTTATDLVLTVTQMLRQKGVVGKFVEFFGTGLDTLTIADRATISNMAPEYGATCGMFPIDEETLKYLRFTGRSTERIQLVEAYAKEQGMWRERGTTGDLIFSDTLTLDLRKVEPSLAGPKRPQDRVAVSQVPQAFKRDLTESFHIPMDQHKKVVVVQEMEHSLGHGDVVIAAITSCTNTSNPAVLVHAGLVARKARQRGLQTKPWVKTSLAPGSQVVTDYLERSGLQKDLDALGFHLVGYGCTTCIGNSGPLPEPITQGIEDGHLVTCSILSGNRNFEGRVNPHTRANYLASPPLCVVYALTGSIYTDLFNHPLGTDHTGQPVFLKDIWPTQHEIQEIIHQFLTPEMFQNRYRNVFEGTQQWKHLRCDTGLTYNWDKESTYVKLAPLFEDMESKPEPITDIHQARLLVLLGDSVTTDHISPAGSIKKQSPAGTYLIHYNVPPRDFNSYGSRRGNHEVMIRGTFANIRIRNELVQGIEGGETRYFPSGERMPIYHAAMRYLEQRVPLIVIAGKEYGTGSSRDWAAKGTKLLGVKAVIAESFERIHRSNLIGMGILPLQFQSGQTRHDFTLDGSEQFDITGIRDHLTPHKQITVTIYRVDGSQSTFDAVCRIDTLDELAYYRNGGILQYVLRSMLQQAA